MREHDGTEHRLGAGIGTFGLAVEPREEIEIGWLERVPDLFDLGDVAAIALGQRRAREARRNADTRRSAEELQKRPTAGGIELIEKAARALRALSRRAVRHSLR